MNATTMPLAIGLCCLCAEAGPYKAAMHMHTSMSEGSSTVHCQAELCELLGYDVLYITDHDAMIADEVSAQDMTTFSFDDWVLPLDDGEPWTPASAFTPTKSVSLWINQGFTNISAEINNSAFDLTATGPQSTGQLLYVIRCPTGTGNSTLSVAAGLRIHLSIRPDALESGVLPVVMFRLSMYNEQYLWLRYYLDNSGQAPSLVGTQYSIPIPYVLGEWNDVVMDVTADAVSGFPFVDGLDNAVTIIGIGLEGAQGATGTVGFDSLLIDRALTGDELYAVQVEIIDRVAAEFPTLRIYQSLEHSATQHMLEYGEGMVFPDWPSYFGPDHPGFVGGRIVNAPLHNGWIVDNIINGAELRGHVVSWAHPFGPGVDPKPTTLTKEALLAKFLNTRGWGTRLLEVGYTLREGTQAEHLWVWDQLHMAGIHLTGVGVLDAHSGIISANFDYINRGATWIHAASDSQVDLVQGLRDGRVFFGDGVTFDDISLDMVAENGARMGDVSFTSLSTVGVRMLADALEAGDLVEVVRNTEVIDTLIMPASGPLDYTVPVVIDPGRTVVRFQVHRDCVGHECGLWTNPIVFVFTPCACDLDNDGDVDVSDFGVFAIHYGEGPGATRATGDFNGDGYVDVVDFGLFVGEFGCTP